MKKIYPLLLIVLLALFSCTNGNREALEKLSCADRLMTISPDSSLILLNEVDTLYLSEDVMAHYALLISKARNKNYIFEDSDSLICRAFEYYNGKNDSLEVQSAYYEGEFLSRQKRYDEALFVLTETYDKAVNLCDWFYAGLCARAIAHVNRGIYYTADELKWAHTAKKMFLKSGHIEHAGWMDLSIAWALVYNSKPNEALALCDSVNANIHDNTYFRHQILLAKSDAQYRLGKFIDVFKTYEVLDSLRYKKDAYDHVRLADIGLKLGNGTLCSSNLKIAQTMGMDVPTSLYSKKVSSLHLASIGNFHAAYDSAFDWGSTLMAINESRMTHPQIALAAENYRMKSLIKHTEANELKSKLIYIIITSVVCALGLIVLALYLKNKLYTQNILSDKYLHEAENLKRDLNDSIERLAGYQRELAMSQEGTKDLKNRIHEIEFSHCKKADDMTKDLRMLFSMHIDILNGICNLRYQDTLKNDNATLYRQGILKSIKKIQNFELIENLSRIINKNDDGWMESLKSTFPDFSDNEYLLAMYLYIGFKPETIAVLMGKPNTQAVHNSKHKLKKKILASTSCDTHIILSKLHML